MITRRTDLAVEARELWQESAGEQTKLEGVQAEDDTVEGYPVSRVHIIDWRGEKALGKPAGHYVTVELKGLSGRAGQDAFGRAVRAVAAEVRPMLGENQSHTALIVGLGNRNITPDAVGPLCVEHVMVTRHLVEKVPEHFGHMREVTALSPGVLGTTGIESVDILSGVVAQVKPDMVIVVDALASRKLERLCTTIQISDTGIVPGSGVGNARGAINAQTLGVPVVAMGVPTVVDAATLAADLGEQAGFPELDPEVLRPFGDGLIVTPKDIDSHVDDIARVIGYAVNLALHKDMTVDDIAHFLS